MAEQLDRFRSFSERYIIERAGKFEIGREQEQAWLALQDAKKIYEMIGTAAVAREPPFQAGGHTGATGAYPIGNQAQGPIIQHGSFVPPMLQHNPAATPVKSAPPPTVPKMFLASLPPTTGLLQKISRRWNDSKMKGY